MWRIRLCGIDYSSGGILAILCFCTPHNLDVRLLGDLSVSLISRSFGGSRDERIQDSSSFCQAYRTKIMWCPALQ